VAGAVKHRRAVCEHTWQFPPTSTSFGKLTLVRELLHTYRQDDATCNAKAQVA
jgi:hypothetical protein